uniref:Uncharacterized protein n=1 Tax=Rhizophora mucronata TaxID=61149 RepID=A0A2P2JBQ9_RHIMU
MRRFTLGLPVLSPSQLTELLPVRELELPGQLAFVPGCHGCAFQVGSIGGYAINQSLDAW